VVVYGARCGANQPFDTEGKLINDGTRKFLGTMMAAFGKWIAANAA
jgi:hypothetical protein